MHFIQPTKVTLFGAALALVAACHDGVTAPQPVMTNFDARHAFSKIDPLAAVLNQPIFTSFNGALSSFETFFRTAPVGSASIVSGRGTFGARLTRTLAPAAQIRASAIPDNVKGKTFAWDVSTRTYVADATITGAPPNGVRFVLYNWEVLNGPTIPLNRVGYIDIAPAEGDGNGAELTELFMVRDAPRLPVADFIVMHSTTGGVNNFGIEGSATDGFTVDLIELTGTYSGTAGQHHLVYNTGLSSSPPAVSAIEQLTYDQGTATQGGRLELSYEGHKLTDESVAAGAEVKFDGSLYARVIFPPTIDDQTQYLRPDGTSLSQQEIVDLNALLERTIVANFFWIALAWP
jgi:hypothetical protein